MVNISVDSTWPFGLIHVKVQQGWQSALHFILGTSLPSLSNMDVPLGDNVTLLGPSENNILP